MSDVAIRPVTPDQHDAVLHYFDMVAYADNPNWSKCFCMEKLVENFEERTKAPNRAARSELLLSAKTDGMVAYRLGRVVGWCHATPKSELLEVPGERAADIGAIVCVIVAPDQRRQGIATQLLHPALEHLLAQHEDRRGPQEALGHEASRVQPKQVSRSRTGYSGSPKETVRDSSGARHAVVTCATGAGKRNAWPHG